MPALPGWYIRVPEILDSLKSPLAPPFLDRPAVERLFQVSRRQAIRLLGYCGGYQVGKTFLADRKEVVAFLQRVVKSGGASLALGRKRRVLEALHEVERSQVAQKTKIPAEVFARRQVELSPAIERVAPGKLQITYHGAEDLLTRIVELTASASSDFPSFRKMVEDE